MQPKKRWFSDIQVQSKSWASVKHVWKYWNECWEIAKRLLRDSWRIAESAVSWVVEITSSLTHSTNVIQWLAPTSCYLALIRLHNSLQQNCIAWMSHFLRGSSWHIEAWIKFMNEIWLNLDLSVSRKLQFCCGTCM